MGYFITFHIKRAVRVKPGRRHRGLRIQCLRCHNGWHGAAALTVMKKSTANIFKMHGWRVDNAIHNYIYFVFYDKYVKAFLASGRYLMKTLGPGRINSLAFKTIFENYHAKVLTPADARKIVSLNRDLAMDAGKAKRIIPFSAANKVIFSISRISLPSWTAPAGYRGRSTVSRLMPAWRWAGRPPNSGWIIAPGIMCVRLPRPRRWSCCRNRSG
jgi:hypothetical protein